MGYSFFHWGISQWAIFAIVGLVIGFLQFRKKKDGLISTALEPLTGSNKTVRQLSIHSQLLRLSWGLQLHLD